jgi:hypothetical protein
MSDVSRKGRELFDAVRAEEDAKDRAELEAWYQDYHHWNHDDARDRIAGGWPGGGRWRSPGSLGESVWFRLFRRAIGLPAEAATPDPYRRYRFFPNRD